MRKNISISLPQHTQALIKKEVKEGGYATVSEFFRALLRDYEEKKILKMIEQGRKEYREGKTTLLRSLSDLD